LFYVSIVTEWRIVNRLTVSALPKLALDNVQTACFIALARHPSAFTTGWRNGSVLEHAARARRKE
jgi:hypothetical protein